METNNVAAILASTVIKRLRWGSRAFSIIPKVKLFNLWLEIQSALGCCWYFTFCRKNVAAADWYSQQQNDEDYFIMRQKRIAYTFISIFCQILNFEGGWHGLQRWERKSSFLWRKKLMRMTTILLYAHCLT